MHKSEEHRKLRSFYTDSHMMERNREVENLPLPVKGNLMDQGIHGSLNADSSLETPVSTLVALP
jgi:hypothetical protein